MSEHGTPTNAPAGRRRRSDGERSRQAILRGATELATLDGLEGLSIGRLAEHIGMSKSGLYAHFGSKEELQLATIAAAQEIFDREVVEPGLRDAAGTAAVLGLCEAFCSYLRRRVFPGGCFFAAAGAELDTREGPVKDELRRLAHAWTEQLESLLRDARDRGELPADADVEQLAFELDALMLGANAAFVMFGDERALERALDGARARLA